MAMQQDFTTFELGETKLSLRDNLRFSIQRGRYGKSYIIEDESTSSFYRIGEAEYTFISLLDGKTTMATALAATCSICGTKAFNERDAAQFCKWLVEAGLANSRASTSARRIRQRGRLAEEAAIKQKLNPISIRFPLFSPDDFITSATKYSRWLLSRPMAVVWIFVCAWALISLVASGDRFASDFQILSRDNTLWLGVTWALLKLVHEFAHALACKVFGGRVGNCGILLLLLIPLPFVDVTSSWRFGNKYHRMLVSAAGMIFELFVAAIATLVWLNVDPGMLSQAAANVMFAASINTLVFNANPLMRFDGYHILADWLEIPNLAKYGHQYVMGIARRCFLGLPASPIPWAGIRGVVVKAYGVLSLLWRVLLCITLVLAAANLMPGIGFLIALIAAVLWLAVPLVKLVKYLVVGTDFEQPNRRWFVAVMSGLILAVFTIGFAVPSPSVITAPVVIDFDPLAIVRAQTGGFVDELLVVPDQQVKENDLLLRLRDPELRTRIVEANAKIRESKLRSASHRKERSIAAWQVEQETAAALEIQLKELLENEKQLEIRAPRDGIVIGHELDTLVGSYAVAGQELLAIGQPDSKEAIAMVAQADNRHLKTALGRNVSLRLWGISEEDRGVIKEISPRVTSDLPHFAFAGAFGGPLDVVRRDQYEGGGEANGKPDSEHESLMLLEPRLKMHIAMDATTSRKLHAGQSGVVHMRLRSGSLGPYLIEETRRWLMDRIIYHHGL